MSTANSVIVNGSLSPFVGRRDEMAMLDAALASASRGTPHCVVVGGEAGVGKTRLVEHWAARIGASVELLTGRCVELGAYGTPLTPFRGVVRDLVDRRGAAALDDLVPDGSLLMRLVSDSATPERHKDTRSGLFEVFGAMLRQQGRERPTVLVLDDVQWADRSSRELIGFLVRTLRSSDVTIVLAYRSDDLPPRHPLRGFLAELERLPTVHRMELGRFNRTDTAELLAGLVGHRLPADRVDRIHRKSRGNALFAEELARSADPDRVPSLLRDLLARDLDRLPPDACDVVSIAALGDRVVPHALLAAATGLTEDRLINALRQVVDARALVSEGDGYRFRHPLLRAAVAQDLLPAHRTMLHRRCAEALEADPALIAADRLPAEIAFHWHEAGDRDKAFPALLDAASAAQKLAGYAEQAELLERALTLQPPEAGRCELFDAAITAAVWAGDPVRALRLIASGLELIDPAAEPERVALLHVQRALALLNLGEPGAAEAMARAEEVIPDVPSPGRIRVLDQLAMAQVLAGRPDLARKTATAGVRISEELGVAALATGPRTMLGWALTELGEYAAAVEALKDLQRRHGDAASGLHQVRLHIDLAKALQGLAEHDAAIDTARDGLAVARAVGLDQALGGALHVVLVDSLIATGEWAAAEAASARALEWDPAPRYATALQATTALLATRRGELDLARSMLVAATGLNAPSGTPETVLRIKQVEAELALAGGRIDDAVAMAIEGLRTAPNGPPPLVGALITAGADAAMTPPLRVGAMAVLRGVSLDQRAESPTVRAYATEFAAQLGDAPWSAAVAAWLAAGDRFRASRARLQLARDALAAGDRAAAAEALKVAATVASRLGAKPLLADVGLTARVGRISLDHAKQDDAAGRRDALGLTPRESDVLRLIAEGRTNRQIADELFISVKTVGIHVSHILTKFGVPSRGAAAAAAHRMRLLDG